MAIANPASHSHSRIIVGYFYITKSKANSKFEFRESNKNFPPIMKGYKKPVNQKQKGKGITYVSIPLSEKIKKTKIVLENKSIKIISQQE